MNHGPWTTALGPHTRVGLSAFWRRRMEMLPTVAHATCRKQWHLSLAVAVLGLLMVVLPSLHLSAVDAKKDPSNEPNGQRIAVKRDATIDLPIADGFNRVGIADEAWQPPRNHVIMAREGENLPLDFPVIPKRAGEQVFNTNESAVFVANVRSIGKKSKAPKLKQSSATNPDTKGAP